MKKKPVNDWFSGTCNNQLRKGQHKYAFSFQLPTNIPSSFYCKFNI